MVFQINSTADLKTAAFTGLPYNTITSCGWAKTLLFQIIEIFVLVSPDLFKLFKHLAYCDKHLLGLTL